MSAAAPPAASGSRTATTNGVSNQRVRARSISLFAIVSASGGAQRLESIAGQVERSLPCAWRAPHLTRPKGRDRVVHAEQCLPLTICMASLQQLSVHTRSQRHACASGTLHM